MSQNAKGVLRHLSVNYYSIFHAEFKYAIGFERSLLVQKLWFVKVPPTPMLSAWPKIFLIIFYTFTHAFTFWYTFWRTTTTRSMFILNREWVEFLRALRSFRFKLQESTYPIVDNNAFCWSILLGLKNIATLTWDPWTKLDLKVISWLTLLFEH